MTTRSAALARRIGALPWADLAGELAARGCARIPELLSAEQCGSLIELYDQPERFRSKIVMSRHGFGRGEYQYFDHPLPPLVAAARAAAYPQLVPIANAWAEQLGQERRFPDELEAFHASCHAAGQTRPTPLLLRYGPGDYNCLHQDVYGELLFPLQLAVLLSEPGADFSGGEFVLTEQRPRMQSRVEVVPLARGDAVIFAVQHRPVLGTKGYYRVNMRHGVSRIRSGSRYTLGVIFHDAA
ncbi:MAG TPA: 2OG-Fe(II) oxygenase [Polyangiales bacterium]|nr:2OG-Fe(II) oxygenase [Polyangiales bacterium]